MALYYLTQWICWDRGPNMPDQAVLTDMSHRRLYFFWIEIWPHEFSFVAGLLIMAGLGLFLFTVAAPASVGLGPAQVAANAGDLVYLLIATASGA